MTGRTGRLQQRDIADDRSAPLTNGDGTATAQAPIAGADQPRHRQEGRAASFGLAVLSVVIVLLGAGAGYYGSLLMPVQYAARAEIAYNFTAAAPNFVVDGDRSLTTQRVLLGSRVVLAPVASDNGMTPEDLAEIVSATVLEDSQIIEVEVRAETRERAQMLLTGVVDTYLAVTNADWQDPVRSFLEFELTQVQTQLQAPGVPVEEVTRLAPREQVLRNLLNNLESSPSPAAPPARLLSDPYPIATQVSPKPLLAAAAGAGTAVVVVAFVVLLVVRRGLRS